MGTKSSQFIQDIRQEVEDYTTVTGDVSEFDSTKDILRWVNDCIQGMFGLLYDSCPSLISTIEEITVIGAGTATSAPTYSALTSTPVMIQLVYDLTNCRTLAPVEMPVLYDKNVQETVLLDAPTYYSVDATKNIYIDMTPSDDVELRVHYVPEATAMAYDSTQSIDTESPYPSVFDRYIKEYAIMRATNRNSETPQLEASIFSRLEEEVIRIAEKRLPYQLYGTGPWTV